MSGLSWVRVTCLVVVAASHSLQHNILHLTPELLGLSYPSIASSKTRKSKSSIFYSKNTSV